jgi:hypothetical protein
MDKQARRERIEKLLAAEEELNKLDELPLTERFNKLAEWVEQNLSTADQEWMYQQWQRVLMFYIKESLDKPASSLVFFGGAMKRVRAEVEITRHTSVEFEVDDDADPEAIKETALEEAALAEWDDDPPEIVSMHILDEPGAPS